MNTTAMNCCEDGEAGNLSLRRCVTWRWRVANFAHVSVIALCLVDIAILVHISAAATITWDTAHYMLSYDQGRFNELMTLAVPLFPKLFWWMEPGIVSYRLVRYAVSVLLALPLALTLWRYALRRGTARPLNGFEVLAWTLTLVLASFLGNAMLLQFWPLGHHDLTSWIYMVTAGLLIWVLADPRPAGWTFPVLLGLLGAGQLLVKIPCFGGLVVFFVGYVLLFIPKGRRLAWFGLYALGFSATLALALVTLMPVRDILAAVAPSRIRFDGAYGAGNSGPVQVILGQLLEMTRFLGEFLYYYWPLLGLCGLLVGCAGRWRQRLGEGWADLAGWLLPVIVATPLLLTVGIVLFLLPVNPNLIEIHLLSSFLQRYGQFRNYGLPLAEYVLFFLSACLADRVINGRERLVLSSPTLFTGFLLVTTPFFMAVGSSQSLLHYIQEGGWSFLALVLLGIFLVKRPVFVGRTFYLIILCLFLIVQQYKYATWLSYNFCLDKNLADADLQHLLLPLPICSKPPLLLYSEPLPRLRHGKGLLFTPDQAAFYADLEVMLRQAGFKPGDNILAFYGLGAAVYLLGGRSPGTPVYYPDGIFGRNFNSRMLALASPEEVKSSFLLINEPLTPDILDVFARDGLDFDQDYVLLGQLPQPDCLDSECYRAKNGKAYIVSVYAPKLTIRSNN